MNELQKTSLAFLRRLAAERGGCCLSEAYVNAHTRLRWRCAERHEWEAIPSSIRRGSWCPDCSPTRKLTLADLQAAAAARGGECLATEYVNLLTAVEWRCAEGHVWTARAGHVRSGASWCPRCSGWYKTIEELRAIAAERGGECLSPAALGSHHKYTWRCQLGHLFRSTLASVIHVGTWCPKCNKAPRGDLERLGRIARRRGGECLSVEYVSSQSNLLWRCRDGHEWHATAAAISSGNWCHECGRGFGRSRPTLTLEDMQATAAERGGKCLSKRYTGVRGRMQWQCARGHEWEAAGTAIRAGGWCPLCAHSALGTIDGMRALAAEHGGRCLSDVFMGRREPLAWLCAAGHRFEALSSAVKSGFWCPRCKGRE